MNHPTKGFQSIFRLLVPFHVAAKLRGPELGSGLWEIGELTPWMAVPKAAMNEDDGLVLWQNDVRSTGQVAAMKPKAITEPVQCPPYRKLRLGVSRPNI